MPGVSAQDRKASALAGEELAEQHCAATNRRFVDYLHGIGLTPDDEALLIAARRKILWVLGDFSFKKLLQKCRWGPGSDRLNKRPYVSPYHKFAGKQSATRSALPIFASLLEGNDLWRRWMGAVEESGVFTPLVTLFRGNRLSTVPKTALIDRIICIEPSVNIHLQLGLGGLIRDALRRRAHINLDSQETNRMCALQSSEDDSMATIDLSSASDTIARRLVQFLIPETSPWFRVLDALRSPFTLMPGGIERLNHKFSSMGNGYTFELETLIFWGITSAVCEAKGMKCHAVYGDDIIVDSAVFGDVTRILELCGFVVNTKKSYVEGYFRESCGMNAYHGYEVASYRLEEALEDLHHLYSFHNGLRRLGLTRAANLVVRSIPKGIRCYGPEDVDDRFLSNPDITTWSYQPYGLEDQWWFWGIRIRSLVFTPDKVTTRYLEPAILHSFATMVPQLDIPVLPGARWGSEGLATIQKGEWAIGETLLPGNLVK